MNTRILTLLAALVLALLWPGGPVAAKCFPLYGNWCGANYPPPGTNPPPVDVYDDACRHHDYCYASPVARSVCDAALARELEVLAYRTGYLPRPLQWVESLLRMKEGGPWGMPFPTPGDMLGAMDTMTSDCGY